MELDKVRDEFDKRYPLDLGDRDKQLAKRRQAFKRSRSAAEQKGLIGCREIDGKYMVWAVEDGALDGGPRFNGHGERDSSVTNATPPRGVSRHVTPLAVTNVTIVTSRHVTLVTLLILTLAVRAAPTPKQSSILLASGTYL